ncbi:hypothetical protein BH10PSE2_BH10PSE2_02020 [soil metagenome]
MSVNKIYAPAVSVAMQGLAYGALGDDAVAVAAATPLPMYSPGGFLTVSASFARPADTTAYASGDLVANNAVAGNVVPIELVGAFRSAGEAVRIERVRLRKSSVGLTSASFRVHLFRLLPTVSAGDNAAFDNGSGLLSLADINGYVGTVDVVMGYAAAIGARGVGVLATGSGITCESAGVVGHETSLWALIEARGAYGPASAETTTLTIEAARS